MSDGKVSPALIDEAVKRILIKKFEMGLFDDPFRFCNTEREKQQWNNLANLEAEKLVAEKSIVLLKNDNQVIAFIKTNKNHRIDRSFYQISEG